MQSNKQSSLRSSLQLVGAIVFGYLAWASYAIWERAAANSASPGAIVLLVFVAFFGLLALLAAIAGLRGLRRH